MNLEQDLKQVELNLKKKAFLTFHQDGIIDILMGWNLIGIGLFLYTHTILISYLGLAALALYYPLKAKITLPRLGHAEFRTKPTPAMWVISAIGGILILVAVIYGFVMDGSLAPLGPIALIVIGGALVLVLKSGFNRIFAYALLVPLFFVVGLGTGFLTPLITIAVGVALMVIGIWMLVNFIGSNPIAEESDVS
jgi:hypothetical protein